MKANTEYQNIDLLGDKQDFSGYPVEVLYNESGYYIKCKEVYVSYASFVKWERNFINNKIGINEEGTPAKISKKDSFTRISCLRESNEEFIKLKVNVKKTIRWHQKQNKLKK
tara:strand:- start:410 stop:745 length:336 start_codon:yes stop_codon:yes gene_type:complete